MFKFRIIGFILLMGLLGGIFFWEAGGAWLFLAAAPALAAAAVGECCAMLNNSGRPVLVKPAALMVWFLLVLVLGNAGKMFTADPFYRQIIYIFAGLLVMLLVIAGCARLLRMDAVLMEKTFTTFGVSFCLVPPLFGLLAAYFPDPQGYWLLFLCLTTKATDTGGYIVGTLTAKLPGGNHKIAPGISPKKSWEGLFGGIILSLAVALAFYHFAPHASLLWYIVAALILSPGSFFGDLTESAIKRLCNIKDSGSFVPGMGGAFDVLDSFIYNGVLFWPLYFIKDIL
ncbi:MAG: phosphatidate cytidylyltransferase [Lentisphaeria bacterium]|nr:phosphatidate cytidylyltransferase [Lentisphaeria bacterium]